MTFKIRGTDLYGRLGLLEVAGRRVETPAFLPVIHPIHQSIPARELVDMGFGAAITNSYIAYKGYGYRISELGGIHGAIGYGGILMTDSGGYQVLEYGDIDVDPLTIAEYQVKMGSDIAVVLDRPTGVDATRERAAETVEATLRAAADTIPLVEGTRDRMMWALPIQGGTHLDLVELSARRSSELPYDMYSVGSPVELMNSYRYSELARVLLTARRYLPPERPIHLFGAGHPLTMALAVAFGADTFDSASYILFAKELRYMTPCGVRELSDLEELPCSCPICSSHGLRELRELPREELVALLARHNLYVLREELLAVRAALREGRLWEYLVQKTMCHPSLYGLRRMMLEESADMEEHMDLFKRRAAFLYGSEDVYRPEVSSARRRVGRLSPELDEVVLVVVHGADLGKARRVAGLEGIGMGTGTGTGDGVYFVQPFVGLTPLGLADSYPFSQNVKPDPSYLSDDVLRRTAVEVSRTLSSWSVRRAMVLYEPDATRLADLLAMMLRESGIDVATSSKL